MRKLFLAVILLLAVIFLVTRFTEVQQVVDTLRRGDPRWLTLAVGVHLVWMVNIAASFRAIYRLLGVEEAIDRLVFVAAAANFVNIVAPSGGISGLAILISDGRKRGHPTGKVTTAAALFILFEYISLLITIGLGLLVLFRRNRITAAEISAAGILVCVALILGTLVYLGMRSGDKLGGALSAIGGLVNRVLRPILHREYLDLASAHQFAHDMHDGLRQVRQSRGSLLLPIALALSNKALLISILFLVFLAFRQPFSVGTLIASFSIGYLFYIVSPTPSGLGFVEGAMTLTMRSLRVPLAAAAVITLAYRGITFWITMLYGAIAIRWVGGGAKAKVEDDPI